MIGLNTAMNTKMKNSGVEWIGDIPENWKTLKLKYVATFQQNKYASEDGKLNYVALENVQSWNGKYVETESVYDREQALICEKGDVLFGKLRPYLAKVYISDKRQCCSGEFVVIRFNERYENKFLWYQLISCGFIFMVDRSTYGTKMPRANVDYIKNVPVVIPPKNTRQKIVAFLDAQCAELDAVLEKTRQTVEEYKKLKQAVITQAVTRGARGKRTMKDSGIQWIGEIPAEWDNISPKALFIQRKDKANPGDRQLTASQLYGVIYQDDYMRLTGAKVVTVEKDFDILKRVEKGDFVISMRSFQGGLEYSELSGSISSAYVMLYPNLNLVFPRYFRWLFKSSIYINALQSTSNLVRDGQAMRYANFAQVRLLAVPIEEQVEIADYLDKKCAYIDSLINLKEKYISEIETYKKSLIYEAVTGKRAV